jgi:hypothetical protein
MIHSGSDSGSGSTTLPGRVCVSALQQSLCSRRCRYFPWTYRYLFNSSLCYAYSSLWPTADCAASQLSVNKSLSYTWTGLSTNAFVCTWGVCLREPELHLDVSVYKSFSVHLGCLSTIEPVLNLCVSVYRRFFVHLGCLSTRACAAITCVSVYKRFYVLLGCLSTRGCAAPMCVLFVLFLCMSVYKSLCFTCM